MNPNHLSKNLEFIDEKISLSIKNSNSIGDLLPTKTGVPTLRVDEIFFHSKYDPIKEAKRLISDLKDPKEVKVYIFFGAGLGYLLQEVLENRKGVVIWMDYYASFIKQAFTLYDYSPFIKEGRFKILLSPFNEETLFDTFKGLASYPVTFVSHKGSFLWKEPEYSKLKFICQKFFKKKDVNIATLTKFEKLWTRNIIQNIPELLSMTPVSQLFAKAKGLPFLVCGAGPSLHKDIDKIRKYKDCFIMICVDTALHVLNQNDLDADLIYSVDPQALNSYYLEGYEGNGKLVFDPTSTYHTLRLSKLFQKGFFSSAPFPLINILKKHSKIEIGDIKFGGSVSTNAVDLAVLMGANTVYLVGQDLAFTDGYAHCRGAVLEERLNFRENRFFRREKHNFRQLTALPKLYQEGYDGKIYQTNEKMKIFSKWFSENRMDNNWINLTSAGVKINNIPNKSFSESFDSISEDVKRGVREVRNVIQNLSEQAKKAEYIDTKSLSKELYEIFPELSNFESLLLEGLDIAKEIYKKVQYAQDISQHNFQNLLQKMDKIDSEVIDRKNLNQMISASLQRVILSITEGYDTSLTLEEKSNERLGIAKKSVLLYNGLLESTRLNRKLLKKVYYRIQ